MSEDQGTPSAEEVAQLRAEVEQLREQVDADQHPRPHPASWGNRTGGWRPVVASILIVVAALLVPLSVLAVWAHDQVSNTDRYVKTVGPLAADPAVQKAVANRISTEIFDYLDVNQLTSQAVDALQNLGLPPRVSSSLSALAVPISNGVQSFVTEQVDNFVSSKAFQEAWVAANREAHAQMVAVLSGKKSGLVQVNGQTVSVNLSAVIDTIKTQLVARGFTLAKNIPEVNAQFTIFQSKDLTKAQRYYRLLDRVSTWLPILALVLLGVAVFIARDRRRFLMWAGIAVAISMVVLGAMLNIFRTIYLNQLPSTVNLPAATSVYDQLVHFIRLNLRAVLVVGLAVAIGAWLSGPSGSAVATRGWINRFIGSLRGGAEHAGLHTGRVGEFAARHHNGLRAVIVGATVLVYVQAAHPTGSWTLKLLVLMVVLLLVLEFLARPAGAASDTTDAAAPRGS
ncbi:MAG TPA: hypothetical protein VMI11_15130 [Actinomycetes bacterium]|nr:hypothetical protein [Actinomycetes bacterium]